MTKQAKGGFFNLRPASWQRLPAWFWSLRKTRWLVGVILGAWLGPRMVFDKPEDAWRYAAGILQFAGMGTVVFGISGKLKHYHGDALHVVLWREMRAVLRSLPLLRQDVTVNNCSAHITARARMQATASPLVSPNAPIEQKVDFLVKQYELQQDHNATLRRQLEKVEERVEALSTTLDSRFDAAATEQRKVAVEGVGVEVLGATWIALGIFIATVI